MADAVPSLLDIMSEQRAEQLSGQAVARNSPTHAPASASRATWASIIRPEDTSAEDDHALAMRLQQTFDSEVREAETAEGATEQAGADDATAADDDLALALQLQAEEQRLFDAEVARRREAARTNRGNGPRRVEVRSAYRLYGVDDAETRARMERARRVAAGEVDDDDEDRADRDDDVYGRTAESVAQSISGARRLTKHDPTVASLKISRRLDDFASAGPLWADRVRLPQSAVGSLQRHVQAQKRKGVAAHGRAAAETRATSDAVLDARTMTLLGRWIDAGELDEVQGVVKCGKEANVYHALATVPLGGGRDDDEDAAEEAAAAEAAEAGLWHVPPGQRSYVAGTTEHKWSGQVGTAPPTASRAVKVFQTTLARFANRRAYIEGDHRYAHVRLGSTKARAVVALWAEKEMKNLIRMHRTGLRCPCPLLQRENILVMSFIGTGGWPAPQLKDARMRHGKLRRAYRETLRIAADMWRKCHLVHGDLSEYNLLRHSGHVWVIDVGQAVVRTHPRARSLLASDLTNVTTFFIRRGIPLTSDADARAAEEADAAEAESDAEAGAESDTEAGAESDTEASAESDAREDRTDSDDEAAEVTTEAVPVVSGVDDDRDLAPCVAAGVPALLKWATTDWVTDAARDVALEALIKA